MAMAQAQLATSVRRQIDDAVESYASRMDQYIKLAIQLNTDLSRNAELLPFIHSIKYRHKDPEHLRNKLERMALRCKANAKPFSVNEKNVFVRIPDLAGVRLLHLHTMQIENIHPLVLQALQFHNYKLILKPVGYTWDIETKTLLRNVGIRSVFRHSMYTSVHYVVVPHWLKGRCELQVRTLMEEVWGEVSHAIDYPSETGSVACREQLKTLARIASGGTRLVDSIFSSHTEYLEQEAEQHALRTKIKEWSSNSRPGGRLKRKRQA